MQIFRIAILTACTAWLAPSCAPTPKAIVVAPPPQTSAPVAPLVVQAKQEAAAARETAHKLETKVDAMVVTTAALRTGLQAATSEADRLRNQKTATEKELDALWRMLTAEQDRAAEMFNQVEASKALTIEATRQRLVAERGMDALAIAATASDIEKANLRAQNASQAEQIAQAAANEKILSDKLRKAETRAAVGSYLKGIVWFLGIAGVLCTALWIAIKIKLI